MTGTQLAPGHVQDEADTLCPQCGAELADDQEWCLECGGARTLIHRGPDWRVPLAVIAAVIVLAIGGFVVAVVSLSNDSSAPTAAATTPSAAQPSTTATGTGTAAGARAPISSWQIGLPGWTVVLGAEHSRAAAYSVAERLAGQGIDVGVLNSTQHPSLAPGFWVVFSGRYATRAAAAKASAQLVTLGQSHAHPRQVGRPGGP